MKTVFIRELKPLLDAVAGEMELYVPQKEQQHYVFGKYDPSKSESSLNNIRACTPAKEFLFPLRELAATYPVNVEPSEVKPFAVFGLKDCDLQSIKILDTVFTEEDFKDTLYISRREKMFVIASDCFDPCWSCFCNIVDGKGFCESGFDLNVAQVKDGFIVEAGSTKGQEFVEKQAGIFTDASDEAIGERESNRTTTQKELEKNNTDLQLSAPLRDIVEKSQGSDIYDSESAKCIECQACTRVCPTCHCFFLYDDKQKDYFTKMKIWDSCMRFSYAAVAGGENQNKVLGDRMKHRLMHKFVYFLDRYGIKMCVGCGRCVDADAGGMDLREILKNLDRYQQSQVK